MVEAGLHQDETVYIPDARDIIDRRNDSSSDDGLPNSKGK